MIHYRNEVRQSGLDARKVKRTARKLLGEVGERDSALSISFVDDVTIRRLNHLHRGKDRATDVLSFPLIALRGALPRASLVGLGTGPQDDTPERLLGDIVISVETARRQAAAYGAKTEAEVERLLIHGLLHIVGHDHEAEDDARRMRAEERRLADAIGLAWPYD